MDSLYAAAQCPRRCAAGSCPDERSQIQSGIGVKRKDRTMQKRRPDSSNRPGMNAKKKEIPLRKSLSGGSPPFPVGTEP